jgi:PAS domain S-box-containing protein
MKRVEVPAPESNAALESYTSPSYKRLKQSATTVVTVPGQSSTNTHAEPQSSSAGGSSHLDSFLGSSVLDWVLPCDSGLEGENMIDENLGGLSTDLAPLGLAGQGHPYDRSLQEQSASGGLTRFDATQLCQASALPLPQAPGQASLSTTNVTQSHGDTESAHAMMQPAQYNLLGSQEAGTVPARAEYSMESDPAGVQLSFNPVFTKEVDYTKNLEGGKKQKFWRKYGQKELKGKNYDDADMIRCYYRCNVSGCNVKRQVEKLRGDDEENAAKIVITGTHNHPVDDADMCQATVVSKVVAKPKQPIPACNTSLVKSMQGPNVSPSSVFVICDPNKEDCPITFASPGFCSLTGYGQAEVVGRNCRFLQGEGSSKHAILQMKAAIENKEEVRLLVLNYKKDGSSFWNLLHLLPVTGMDGNVASYLGSITDVSVLTTTHDDRQRGALHLTS